MATEVDQFVDNPSEELFDTLSKEQLLQLAGVPTLPTASAAVVTRVAHRAAKEQEVDGEAGEGAPDSWLLWEKLPTSVSRDELARQQRKDQSLEPLFGRVTATGDSLATGYFIRAGVLVLRLLRVKHNLSSAYHPQSQGALERFHQSLKSLLRAYCVELARDWEDGLPWLLLAAREVTQESTGFSPNALVPNALVFSPNALVFGHSVRGPLAVLQGQWGESNSNINLTDYVHGFKRRLSEAWRVARHHLDKAQGKMKRLYDRRSVPRMFQKGDRVLALLPVTGSLFHAKFDGPYKVVQRMSDENYQIATPNRRKATQLVHVNLLKAYHDRDDLVAPVLLATAPSSDVVSPLSSASLDEGEGPWGPDGAVLRARLKNSESLKNLENLLSHLPQTRRLELISLIQEFQCLFGDCPSQTHVISHDIDVGTAGPIKQRFYRVSQDKQKKLETEVDYMLANDLAEPSSSSWASQ
ncbi:hypothetical protein ACEWY4_000012 [Coilia grayii]|uniref:Integrase p58-like C-terminal domain-containing protein n=1 Tax=Coilia grayii TaxID=363190 RepID=A0ABD1KVF6_9TELE